MARKTKEESLDLFYFDEKQGRKHGKNQSKKSSNMLKKKKVANARKNDKVKEEKTKDEKFNFNEEIIIGLRRIDEVDEKTANGKNAKKKTKKNNPKLVQKNKSKNSINMEQNVNQGKKQTTKRPVNKNPMQEKQSRQQEIAKKKRKIILKIIKWTTLLCIIIGGIIYTLLSPIFNIKTISVIGNSKISIDEVISLSRIELEQNIFQYKKEEVIKNVKENAYIDTAKVRRKLPDTMEIIISERKASFMIQFANAYALINNQGYILEISDKKESLPMLTGIKTIQEDIHAGNRLCTEDLERLGEVLKIMESATSNGLSKFITRIDIADRDDYILTLQKQKKTVHLGDISNLSTKMLWILKFNELEGNTAGEIILNMNLNDEKNKPYFRRKV